MLKPEGAGLNAGHHKNLVSAVRNADAKLSLQHRPEGIPLKIIAYDNFKPGVSLEDLKPYLREEVANVWRLWKAGIVRENYARADVGGVIIVFEVGSVEEAKRYIDDFPLSKAGLLEWHYLAFDAPLPLEFLFDESVDVAKPWDRTAPQREPA